MRIAALCAMGLTASVATADTVDLFVFENATGVDVSGLDLSIDVVDTGDGSVRFVFANDSSIAGFVTTIYVESTEFTQEHLESPALGPTVGAVKFSNRVTPLEPAGSIKHYGGVWGGTHYGAHRYNGFGNLWSIHGGESLGVDFQLVDASYQDLLGALQTSQFRFAAHVQGIGPGDSSVWVTSLPLGQIVPLPPAALAGAGLLALIGVVRVARRR